VANGADIQKTAETLLAEIMAVTQCPVGGIAICQDVHRPNQATVAALAGQPRVWLNSQVGQTYRLDDETWRQQSGPRRVDIPLTFRDRPCGVVFLIATQPPAQLTQMLKPLVPLVASNILGGALLHAQVNRTHDLFLATMSHEIRVPLAGILGMTDLLRNRPLPAEDQNYVAMIHRCGLQLIDLVSDIMDFSRLSSGQMKLDLQPFNLRECLTEAMETVFAQAHEKGLELTEHVDAQVPELCQGDSRRLRQVITNLLTNGVKFTQQGYVRLEAKVENQELWLSVVDSGQGIPAHAHRTVFGTFVQLDKRQEVDQKQGIGLGLSICKNLVDMMGGTIQVARSVVGQGTTMLVQLPLTPVDRPSPRCTGTVVVLDRDMTRRVQVCAELMGCGLQALGCGSVAEAELFLGHQTSNTLTLVHPDTDEGLQDLQRLRRLPQVTLVVGCQMSPATVCRLLADNQGLGAKPPTRVRLSHAARQLRVLVVEDDQANRLAVVGLLRRLGLDSDRVLSAQDGQEAVDLVGRCPRFHLILMDLKMPRLDGLDATRQILRDNLNPPQVIALTAFLSSQVQTQCRQAGMAGFLQKPLLEHDIYQTLERAVGQGPAQHRHRSRSTCTQRTRPSSVRRVRSDRPHLKRTRSMRRRRR